MANCPCHDDRTASLSITKKHDRILLRCHAGCSTQEIIDRLGLDWPDLFADGVEGHRSRFNVRPSRPVPPPLKRETPPLDFGPLLTAARKLPTHRQQLLALADELGSLPEARNAYATAAEALGVVWLPRCPSLAKHLPNGGRGWRACWGVPERDADGQVIGITRRYPGGEKKAFPGGKRGLVYSDGSLEWDGPVLLPEGASDVIALAACGLRAVGRPSNVGWAEVLSCLLSHIEPGSEVVVIGENDRKPDGRWPGKYGMMDMAGKLAQSVPSVRVLAAITPDGAKDARAWLAGRSGTEAGWEFLEALRAARSCNPLREKDQREGDCTTAPDHLVDLPNPPPAFACRRGGSSLLNHTTDTARFRASRFACDGWACPVCRQRNSHTWVNHLADRMAETANAGGRVLACEVARDRLDRSLARQVRRRGGEWAALELIPGIYLMLMGLPAGAESPAGSEVISLADACSRMVAWAKEVRSGPEPFSKQNKKMRPVRTSAGWRLNKPESSGEWAQVAPLDTQDPDEVLKVVRDEGGRVTCDTTDPGERGGTSLVWLAEWRADPATAQRITERLKCLDDLPVPPPPGRPPTDEELMACNPFTEGEP